MSPSAILFARAVASLAGARGPRAPVLCFLVTACGGTFQVLAPQPNTTVSSPVATSVKWTSNLQPNSLHITVDNTDVTNQFAISGQAATASLPLAAGNHGIQVNGNLYNAYDSTYEPQATSLLPFSVFMGSEGVVCSVFNDSGANLSGPTDAVYVSGSLDGKACMPDGTATGTCRQWFGQCTTVTTAKPVHFYVFDDGGTKMVGPSTAVSFLPSGNQACVPDT